MMKKWSFSKSMEEKISWWWWLSDCKLSRNLDRRRTTNWTSEVNQWLVLIPLCLWFVTLCRCWNDGDAVTGHTTIGYIGMVEDSDAAVKCSKNSFKEERSHDHLDSSFCFLIGLLTTSFTFLSLSLSSSLTTHLQLHLRRFIA